MSYAYLFEHKQGWFVQMDWDTDSAFDMRDKSQFPQVPAGGSAIRDVLEDMPIKPDRTLTMIPKQMHVHITSEHSWDGMLVRCTPGLLELLSSSYSTIDTLLPFAAISCCSASSEVRKVVFSILWHVWRYVWHVVWIVFRGYAGCCGSAHRDVGGGGGCTRLGLRCGVEGKGTHRGGVSKTPCKLCCGVWSRVPLERRR
jgi:hypothetical protein